LRRIDAIGIVRGYKAHLLDGRCLVASDNASSAHTNMVISLMNASDWLRVEPSIVRRPQARD
jgi:hypothetical protein